MQFIVQYRLKSDIIINPTTERVFDNTTELRDWIKPRLDNQNLDGYEWTILLDKGGIEGCFTVLHSDYSVDDLLAKMEIIPKYKAWVKPYATQIRQLLNL